VVAVKIRSPDAAKPLLGTVTLQGQGAELVTWHKGNETAVIKLAAGTSSFNFTAV
jgi:hypothetical protein